MSRSLSRDFIQIDTYFPFLLSGSQNGIPEIGKFTGADFKCAPKKPKLFLFNGLWNISSDVAPPLLCFIEERQESF